MKFEFDPSKSDVNKEKHGIDFEDAQQLWDDDKLVVFHARVMEESRYVAVGMIGEQYWTAVITYRGEGIRIISVRRSRGKEIKGYEGKGI